MKTVCMVASLAVVCALSGCAPYVPVKQDYSKNERLQADLDATLLLREKFREERRRTPDLERKAEITTRILGLNSDIVSIKVSMGYPRAPFDPVDPLEAGQQDNFASRAPAAIDYGTAFDNQGIDQSSAGTSGGAMVGSALGSAAYIDRAFRPGNNYSAVAQLGAGLLGALVGSQLDRQPVSQFRVRYALRRRDGEIVSRDSVQQDAFRHLVGMCLRIADLLPVSQTLCAP